MHVGGPSEARQYRSRALLLCYAPPRDPMAADALAAFAGDKLVHVGEHEGETSTRRALRPRPVPAAPVRRRRQGVLSYPSSCSVPALSSAAAGGECSRTPLHARSCPSRRETGRSHICAGTAGWS